MSEATAKYVFTSMSTKPLEAREPLKTEGAKQRGENASTCYIAIIKPQTHCSPNSINFLAITS